MKAREQGLLITLILAAGVAAWALEIPRWRLVTMPDGSSRLITWPERPARDAVYQAEVGRAIVRKDLEADDWSNDFARPYDPARADPVDRRFGDVIKLTADPSWDDFPAVASHPEHGTWVTWISFNGQLDELRLAQYHPEPGAWGTWNHVPTARGELWRPTLVVDDSGGVVVLWSQREEGRYDLFARRFHEGAWGPRQTVGQSVGSDLDPEATLGPDGTIHVVWQAFDGDSDVFYARSEGSSWSEPLQISTSNANDWEPEIAVTADGTAHIVWDGYADNDYDVFTRTVGPDGKRSDITFVAATPAYEARASVTIDGQGRVWYAWDRGPAAWAKDNGSELPLAGKPQGTRIYDEREIEVRVNDHGTWKRPATSMMDVVDPQRASNDHHSGVPIFNGPELHTDAAGRVHMLYRQYRSEGFFSQWWTEYLTTMTDSGWSKPVVLPWSEGRLSMTASISSDHEKVWVAWPRDNYPTVSTWMDLPQETLVENVYVAPFEPGGSPGDDLVPFVPSAATSDWNDQAELEAVARLRAHRVTHGDRELRLVRGDAHRHTDLSSDIRGVPDGSALDMYRYFLDAAHLDWGVQTDHQGGSDRVYWWWLTTKLADLYTVPEHFVSVYGYERSIEWPHGHRNVLFAERGHAPVPIHAAGITEQDYKDRHAWLRPHVFAQRALEHDTLYLYEELHRANAVAIPHTTGSWMGTDWRFHDPEIDVAVEIFQGKRNSYEHVGAPLTADAPEFAGGMVHEAWKKGHRIGTIASSDHSSTHISYAMVWVEELTREGILEALRARRSYGATDEILLDVRIDDHLMGEQFEHEGPIEIEIRVHGTAPVARVVVFKNETPLATLTPERPVVNELVTDAPAPGPVRYYLRVEQADGNVAWSSPFWVTVRESEPPSE